MVGTEIKLIIECNGLSSLHVLCGVRSEGLIQTGIHQTIRLTSEIDDIPFLPVFHPDTNAPAPPRPVLDPVVSTVVRYTRMGELNRRGNRPGNRGTKASGAFKREKS